MTIVVPFRRESPKSRLPDRWRRELADAMLEDVLAACRAVAETRVADAPGGLGSAVAAAVRPLSGRPVAIVNADVPAVTPRYIRRLLAAAPPDGVAIVAAVDGTVNALAYRDGGLFSPQYGVGSARRFAAAAPSVFVDIPNLVADVDTLDDLQRIAGRAGRATRLALARLGAIRRTLEATPRAS